MTDYGGGTMSNMTIVISCPDFYQAKDAYTIWNAYLELEEPGSILDRNEAALCIETEGVFDGVFRYIFCDYRMEEVLGDVADVIMGLDEFLLFEGCMEVDYGLCT